jgi:hypothetical protein
MQDQMKWFKLALFLGDKQLRVQHQMGRVDQALSICS